MSRFLSFYVNIAAQTASLFTPKKDPQREIILFSFIPPSITQKNFLWAEFFRAFIEAFMSATAEVQDKFIL